MSRSRQRAAFFIVIAALLTLIIPPFINVNRFRVRLAETISKSLARPVSMGNISLRMLPQPQFVVEDLVIGDDPAFSAEPMLRSEEVTASLRISSLWRGRLEIAKLHFRYPSLNLVRDSNDRWNFESLLNTAKQVPSAPSTKKQAEARPRFPYIESDSGRINFKIGAEKKALALTDADFSLWQETENQWNMRLEARPMRTDANLEDTGTLRIEGNVQRAPELRSSPIQMRVEIDRAQLGQFSHFVSGQDGGWRGDLHVRGDLKGTAEELAFNALAEVNNFRRYDLAISEPLSLTTQCVGRWYGAARRQQMQNADPPFTKIECQSPLGHGSVMFDASLTRGSGWNIPAERLAISGVSLAAVGTILRHAKANLPNDFAMTGAAEGDFHLESCTLLAGCTPSWRGGATVTGAAASSNELKAELHVPSISLAYAPSQQPRTRTKSKNVSDGPTVLSVLPFRLALGSAGMADISGTIQDSRVALSVKGKGPLIGVLNTSRLLGLRATKPQVTGDAQFDLAIGASLGELVPPMVTGSAKLQAVSGRVPGMAAPLEIASADVLFHSDSIELRNMRGSIPSTHTSFDGQLTWHRCDSAPCRVDFDLHATELNLEDLNRLLNPALRESSWIDLPKRLFSDSRNTGPFPSLSAAGVLRADRLVAKSLVAAKIAAQVTYMDGVVQASNVAGEIAGGAHTGEWRADFSGATPHYRGTGSLHNVNASAFSQMFASNVAAGKVDLTYSVTLAGANAAALAQSAAGTIDFLWNNGSLWSVQLSSTPLQFKTWQGRLEIADGKATLPPSNMDTLKGTMDVRGEVLLPRDVNLVISDGAQSITVVGPLDGPSVNINRTQAASKSQDVVTRTNK